MIKNFKDDSAVWCLVMFDLPVKTKGQRTSANLFRNQLLDLGFSREQFSVYAQYLPVGSRLAKTVKEIKSILPSGGSVEILAISDRLWSGAYRFSGGARKKPPETPTQLEIF